jgi:hypothetical protein
MEKQQSQWDVVTINPSFVGGPGINPHGTSETFEIMKMMGNGDMKMGAPDFRIGAVDVPSYLTSVKIPSGYISNSDRKEMFNAFLIDTYGTKDIVEDISNNQVFLDREKVKSLGLNLSEVQQQIANEQIKYDNVSRVYTATTMRTTNFTTGAEALLQNGFNQKRSGDVIIVNDASYISYSKTGSTHGSGLNYDTHVPLLFFGKGIKKGQTLKKTEISDIAPTISALLGISFPNGAIGQPLDFVMD